MALAVAKESLPLHPHRFAPKKFNEHQLFACLVLMRGRGPRPEIQELVPLLDAAPQGITLHHVYADAGFDSQANHAYAREEHGILTTIPPSHGWPSKDNKPPAEKYRRMMKETWGLRRESYGQRWQVETVNSMFKRNQGDQLAAQSHWPQQRELGLIALTHNVVIVR